MKEENTHKFGNGLALSCLCGKHKKDSDCEVYLRNTGTFTFMKCDQCGKRDNTVSVRSCGYSEEINGTTVMEQVCDACEHEHLMDI